MLTPSDPPAPPRMRLGLSREPECQRVPTGPAPELGISTARLRRPVAAGAFLLGPPEGEASEREALPAASLSLGQVRYRRVAITAVPGWGGWARIAKYFDLLFLDGRFNSKPRRQGGKEGA